MKITNKTNALFFVKFMFCFLILVGSSLSLNLDRQFTRIYVDNMEILFPIPNYIWTDTYDERGRSKDVRAERKVRTINKRGKSNFSSWKDFTVPLFMLCALVFATPGLPIKKLMLFGTSLILFLIFHYLFILWKMDFLLKMAYGTYENSLYQTIIVKNGGIRSIYPVILWISAIALVYRKEITTITKKTIGKRKQKVRNIIA